MNVTYRSMDESRTTASLRCSTTMVWPPARKIASPECFLPSGFHLLYILTDRTRSQAELGGGQQGSTRNKVYSTVSLFLQGGEILLLPVLLRCGFFCFCRAISRVQVILQIILCSIMTHGHFCQEQCVCSLIMFSLVRAFVLSDIFQVV